MTRSATLVFGVALTAASLHAQTPPAGQQTPAQQPAAAQPALGPNTWQIDSSHTAAQFSVRHMMVSTVRGTLGRVTGTVDYDGKTVESIKADVSIDVAGVNTGVQNRDNDLRSNNFFDVATYPTITFKSKRAEPAGAGKFKLIGDLTIHGVTKEVTLDVDGPSPPLKQQNGALKVGASASTKVNRRDFGLNYNRLVEAAPVVGDEISIVIDIEINKRPAASQ
jgi:polyisoprenoid-binding protein YceI